MYIGGKQEASFPSLTNSLHRKVRDWFMAFADFYGSTARLVLVPWSACNMIDYGGPYIRDPALSLGIKPLDSFFTQTLFLNLSSIFMGELPIGIFDACYDWKSRSDQALPRNEQLNFFLLDYLFCSVPIWILGVEVLGKLRMHDRGLAGEMLCSAGLVPG